MGNKLIRLSFLCLALVIIPLAACASDPKSTVEVAEVSGYSLELDNYRCVLSVLEDRAVGTKLELSLKPPCYFSRSEENIQKYSFKDIGIDDVLVVVGTPVTQYHIEKWDLTEKDAENCGAQHQGILILRGEVKLSGTVSSGGLACRYYGIDQKVFWEYAHEAK